MPESENEKSVMSRRGVLKTATAVGVGSTATVGGASRMGGSPVGSAQAIAPALVVGGGIAAGLAVSYLIKNVDNPFTGDSTEEYDETNADAVKAQLIENSLNMRQAEVALLTTLENLVPTSKNYVIAEAKKAAIDEFNADNTTQAAQDAAKAVIDDFYTKQQKNLATHYEANVLKLRSWIDQANSTDLLSSADVFRTNNNTGIVAYTNSTIDIPLVDGTTKTIEGGSVTDGNNNVGSLYYDDATNDNYTAQYDIRVNTDSGNEMVLETTRYRSLQNTIISEHGSVATNMETLISELGTKYQLGEINSGDIISPGDLVGDGATQDDYSQAGAQLAALGLQSSKFAMEIELVETGETVEGSIYHSDDSIDSLQQDVQYNPETDIQGTVYLAYNNTDDQKGELIALEEPFIIRRITDGEGNEYNAANYTSKNQQTYDSEVQKIQEELDQIRALREDLEEQRDAAARDDAAAGGAGGGFFEGSNLNLTQVGIGLGALGVVYALLGGGSS